MIKSKKILVIAGMTGLGKTDIAFKLSKQMQAKIIVGDAIQVYKNWPIASNHPPLGYQQEIKYYGLGQIDVNSQQITAVDFKNQVLKYISVIIDEHVIIEGGSCFYLDYLLNSKSEKFTSEQIDESYKLLENYTKDNKPLSAVLSQLCPSYDNSIDHKDNYRLEKAIRYALLTNGNSFSVNNYKEEGLSLKEQHDVRGIFLYSDTSFVQPIIDKRCDQMISNGFLDEFITYMSASNQRDVLPIGYKETMIFFNRIIDHFSIIHYSSKQAKTKVLNAIVKSYVQDFQTRTRQYALYQRKYFRQKGSNFIWHNMNEPLSVEEIKRIWSLERKDYDDFVDNVQNQNKIKSTQESIINKTIKSVPLETNFTQVMQEILGNIVPQVREMKKFDLNKI